MTTIKDVAKLAGVSVATVSRVMNNNTNVRAGTIKKVNQAMKELNYYPNSLAKNFSKQSTKRIALIIDVMNDEAFANPYFYQVQFGIEKHLSQRGYSLSIYNRDSMENKSQTLEKLLFERQVDGLIIHAMLLDEETKEILARGDVPFVCIGEVEDANISCVDVDNKQAGYKAAEALIQDQHKNIMVIYDKSYNIFNKERLIGIQNAVEKQKEPIHIQYLKHEPKDFKESIELGRKIVNTKEIDGFITLSNTVSLGIQRAILEEGYNVPGDYGIITFDKYPAVEISSPKLSTIDIDIMVLGSNVAMVLLDKIEEKDLTTTKLKLSIELSRRETTRNLRGK